MGLLSIIRKIKKKEKEMRILMVGLDNSGKTTIVLKMNGEDTSVISPTLGFNIKTIIYQKYTLNIWDVGGQKTIRSYWRNYFEQTDGLVWVVDSSDLRRLDDCKMELDNLLKEERLAGSSLLILANKQDIQGALTPEEIGKVLNLESMDKSRHWKIVGCSAYTGEGLLEGFDWLRLAGSSLLILANKQDIQGALTPEEIGKVLNLESMDKSRHWKIVGCSAYTGEGLLEGFDWLVQDIASRIYMLD
ncbi:BnaC07g03380D [Brassica napus]|uniref:ADP-ribosylation factor-like protein 2 n=1 Tax=Brassica napus TaxID=3708 RepID=A0A078FJ97_BRANA|nr:BnaC07g03380D [Brassica napus]